MPLTLALPLTLHNLWGGQSCLGNPARSRLSGGFSSHAGVIARGKGRLKAGCSQDWLPHDLCRFITGAQSKWH
jgi:hypothetical protein